MSPADERHLRRQAMLAMIDAADEPKFDAEFEQLARRAGAYVLAQPSPLRLVDDHEDARGE